LKQCDVFFVSLKLKRHFSQNQRGCCSVLRICDFVCVAIILRGIEVILSKAAFFTEFRKVSVF